MNFNQKLITGVISSVFVILTIIIIAVVFQPKTKEGFLTTPQGAYLSETGAIKGPNIITDSALNKPWNEVVDSLNKTGYANDGKQMLGVTAGDSFDSLYQNQLDIIDITKNASDGMFDHKDMTEISGKIASAANNSSHNIYKKGGPPTKMIIAKGETRGVIESKYLPEKERNRKLATVDTVIYHPGYDVNIERLGENLSETHFSNSSNNKRTSRLPTAAAAVGGGGRFGKGIDVDETRSANFDAINQIIKVNGDQLSIVKDIDKDGNKSVITAGLNKESFTPVRSNLVYGNEPVGY